MAQTFDVAVIGSGPGGYVAAIRAAQLGLKTAVIERDALGGICLNWGCIPTKALLKTAEIYRHALHGAHYGLTIKEVSFDPKAVIDRSRKVAQRLSGGIGFLMKKHKITVIKGEARLEKSRTAPTILVRGADGKEDTISATHVILATGARARTIPAAGLVPDGKRVWTYREAMTPPEWPKSLVVFGSGAIGIEFASFYRTFGVDVTVIELQDRILPVEDPEISALAHKAFESQGIALRTGAQDAKLVTTADGVEARFSIGGKPQTVRASHAILAVGITGNVENLGLEALGVGIDRGHVKTTGFGQTGVAGLYAIGDVTGGPWLAHKASHEAVACIEALAGLHPHPLRKELIPGCTYSSPQIASIGLTEAAAKASGRAVRVGRFPFVGNGKAIAMGEDQGLVKTVVDAATGELLGAHLIGTDVTELIQGYAIAMTGELTEAELAETIFPHPTLSEMMHESILDAGGRVLHI